ncbi:MAG: carbamoyltransferase HypF [Gemmatimonadetes bacterium]|nr:carbamoyltransferase HypF [Gemmatimonadota bacterium]
MDAVVRVRVRVRGTVQGVGYRPFVWSLAHRLGVAGHVGNDADGVFIEAESGEGVIRAFLDALEREAPPLAAVEEVEHHRISPVGEGQFAIVASPTTAADRVTPVSPDVALCEACRRELRDPSDRRYRYPFINCTDCGPRFTITRALPYDRPRTTMAVFTMCALCQAEYDDPSQRRFHAQANACPDCGPHVEWRPVGDAASRVREDAITAARACLAADGIVAVKGIGGFHLACRATSAAAIATLRARKHREEKPFAVMAPDLETVRRFAIVGDEDARLLQGRERPIVILARSAVPTLDLPAGLGPGHHTLGVMLPYSPLHELLLAGEVLVMTSGNLSDEPIARTNDEAIERLSPLVDGFLLHDREIHVATDDSVIRHVDGRELPIRRSRGYAPYPVRLPYEVASVLAVGGELKATGCLTRDHYAFLSQHIGDVGNHETLAALQHACAHLEHLFEVSPRRVACDLHPGYASTQWAITHAAARGLPLTRVQHHHAHLVALAAEHGWREPLLAFVFDGTGLGTDQTIWGGEVLLGDASGFERLGHLAPTPLPGGDAAIRRPSRMALAQLRAAGVPWSDGLPPVADWPEASRAVLARQLERKLHCAATTSMGRFLDAAASIVGLRQRVSYEGQAAIELEALATTVPSHGAPYAFTLREQGGSLVFDGGPVLAAAARDVLAGGPAAAIARRVHDAVREMIVAVADALRDRAPGMRIGLTGGVFQNVLLTREVVARLRHAGFTPMTHHLVPPNDGGLALGQALVAAHVERHG